MGGGRYGSQVFGKGSFENTVDLSEGGIYMSTGRILMKLS